MTESPLHILKLCVGIDRPEELAEWQAHRALKGPTKFWHVTRMWPRREAEVLAGGSIYWVMKGAIVCRQRIAAMEEVAGDDGIRRCKLVFAPELIRTVPVPKRAFQGWRYLEAKDAPADLGPVGAGDDEMPEELRRALAEIGVV